MFNATKCCAFQEKRPPEGVEKEGEAALFSGLFQHQLSVWEAQLEPSFKKDEAITFKIETLHCFAFKDIHR